MSCYIRLDFRARQRVFFLAILTHNPLRSGIFITQVTEYSVDMKKGCILNSILWLCA